MSDVYGKNQLYKIYHLKNRILPNENVNLLRTLSVNGIADDWLNNETCFWFLRLV